MASLLPFRDINVHSSASHYAFTSPSSPSAPTLVVERPTGDLRLNQGSLLGTKRVSSIAGILGMIKLRLDKYIIVITKAQPMGRIKGHMVYKIIATEFLPLRERPLHDPDEDNYLDLVKTLLKTGPMYFSYSFDLTNSFQRQAKSDPSKPLWMKADDRFFWNRFIQTDLIAFRINGGSRPGFGQQKGEQIGVDPYILPVMFGMMEIKQTSIHGTLLTFILISRRSRHRAGTRYFSRGIDDQGHVSNFNETEQIVILNDSAGAAAYAGGHGVQNGAASSQDGREPQILSFLQTRGSVPVYWAEVNNLKYTPALRVRSVDSAVSAARRHFEEQIRVYGDNYLVNLVKQKGREQRVKAAYEQMVKTLMSSTKERKIGDSITNEKLRIIEPADDYTDFNRLHYVYFDFHNETKGLKWHRAQALVDTLSDGLMKQQYFHAIEKAGDASSSLDVRAEQHGVVRTNCMDCLDRTNLIQSMVARWTLDRMLTDLGVLQKGQSVSGDSQFEFLFRNVWADNADVVSKSYSGTGALKTDFTRTGERTKAGMLQDLNNSITRYVKNNFLDGPRQDAFDLFLGSYLPAKSGVGYGLLFVDRRPILIQAIPYLLLFSAFCVMIGTFTRRLPDAAVWPLRLFIIVWFLIAAWCFNFIYGHGTLYVNWPKLNQLTTATEVYNDALTKARKDKVIGPFVRERAASTSKLTYMEEGKKRTD